MRQEKHTIEIDGKKVELSQDRYDEVKKAISGEDLDGWIELDREY